jgi:CelD/BcsL family acetyltransferase involved in cellulose biosynthesis
MTPHPTRHPTVSIVEDARTFATLEQEWNDLYRDSPLVTPFQSWAWLFSWWESYGRRRELRLILMRDDEGLLIGILPLMLERRGGFRRLLFVGTGPSDYLDVLAREGYEAEVAEAGARALGQMGPWQVADLHQLRPQAAAWDIVERWNGPKARVWQDGCPMVDVQPWDELLMSLKRKMRYDVRRALRRAQADGVHCERVTPDNAERAVPRWIALHREGWQGRTIDPEHLTQEFESHLEAAARRMIASGVGGVYEFWRNGEVIASHLLIYGSDFVAEYLWGATQDALERYQVSSLNIHNGINVAVERDCASLDLLRGEEPYKLRWATRVVDTHRAVLGRGRVPWTPYAAYYVLRSRAKRYANSEEVPPWITDAVTRFRTLRRKARWYANEAHRPRWINAAIDRLRAR